MSWGAASATEDAAVKTTGRADRSETVVCQDPAGAGRGGVCEDLMVSVAVEKKTRHKGGWRCGMCR